MPLPRPRRRRLRRRLRHGTGVLVALLVVALLPVLSAAADPTRVPTSQLRLSSRGASFIATFEGFRPTPYDDPGGNCTIGFGHLIHLHGCTALDRSRWGTLRRSRGTALLRSDAGEAAAGLRSRLATTRLSQQEFDALVSFVYNIGLGNFDASSVKADLTAASPRYAAVPDHLRLWVYSGGQFLCGLYRRRVNEGHLFSTGSYRISTPTCPAQAVDGPAWTPAGSGARPAVAAG